MNDAYVNVKSTIWFKYPFQQMQHKLRVGTSLNFANENFHLPPYTSSTQTGILQLPNQDEACVVSANKVLPGN
jgi:hypothetical protein